VDIRAVMCSKVVPNEHPMEISAGDIVRLNIHAHVVAKVVEYVRLIFSKPDIEIPDGREK